MTWAVVSPIAVESSKAVIVEVDVPLFIDDTNYEEILGRAFSSPTDRDRLASGLVIVLATKEGIDSIRAIKEAQTNVPVRETLVLLALKRQIVALRWAPVS